jgi:hypothetical protein
MVFLPLHPVEDLNWDVNLFYLGHRLKDKGKDLFPLANSESTQNLFIVL